jgi:hypothetical protein
MPDHQYPDILPNSYLCKKIELVLTASFMPSRIFLHHSAFCLLHTEREDGLRDHEITISYATFA